MMIDKSILDSTAILILNYNDSSRAKELALKVSEFGVKLVLIVDNNSTAANILVLKEFSKTLKKNINILFLKENKGFACGHNEGFRYLENLHCFKYVLEINTDVDFNEDTFKQNLLFLISTKDAIAVSPLCIQEGEVFKNYWSFPTYNYLLKSLFKSVFVRNKTAPFTIPSEKYFKVDAIRGSFQFFNFNYLSEIGFYDEKTFLYYEENILYKKAKTKKFSAYINTDSYYYHNHIDGKKTLKKLLKTRQFDFDSSLYYLKEYEKINIFKVALYRCAYILLTPFYFIRILMKMIIKGQK